MRDVQLKLQGPAIDTIIHPIPSEDHYKVAEYSTSRKYVTMINICKGKGGDIFNKIIKTMKDIPFLAVQTEPLSENLDAEIKRNINGKYLTHVDVKEIYQETRILLLPNHADETFCRVAYEAAANGIPIITTGKGFIKYMLGNSAIYVDENPESWVPVIQKLYHNTAELSKLSRSLKSRVTKYGNDYELFDDLVIKLLDKSPKYNVMIYCPWADQGLGIQSRQYSKLLRSVGYKVNIFSFSSEILIENPQINPDEWYEYDNVYYSYNTRETVTNRELEYFIVKYKIFNY